jgi:hypothetical protein
VIAQAPKYVQLQWDIYGAYVSHRSAVRLTLVERLRAEIANGLGFSAFRRVVAEAALNRHRIVEQQAIDLAERRRAQPTVAETLHGQPATQEFPPFAGPDYGGWMPANGYWETIFLEDADRRREYYERHLQMVHAAIGGVVICCKRLFFRRNSLCKYDSLYDCMGVACGTNDFTANG